MAHACTRGRRDLYFRAKVARQLEADGSFEREAIFPYVEERAQRAHPAPRADAVTMRAPSAAPAPGASPVALQHLDPNLDPNLAPNLDPNLDRDPNHDPDLDPDLDSATETVVGSDLSSRTEIITEIATEIATQIATEITATELTATELTGEIAPQITRADRIDADDASALSEMEDPPQRSTSEAAWEAAAFILHGSCGPPPPDGGSGKRPPPPDRQPSPPQPPSPPPPTEASSCFQQPMGASPGAIGLGGLASPLMQVSAQVSAVPHMSLPRALVPTPFGRVGANPTPNLFSPTPSLDDSGEHFELPLAAAPRPPSLPPPHTHAEGAAVLEEAVGVRDSSRGGSHEISRGGGGRDPLTGGQRMARGRGQ